MTHSTQPSAVKPGTAPAVVPVLARDVTAGMVLHAFDGDEPITGIHDTLSGFRLFFLGRRIRPFHRDDMVCVAVPEGGVA